jgi:branched-subunit amino acid transport protein
MDQQKIFLTIVGMTIVTYLPRFLPAWFLSSRSLPDALQRWLRFVPAAVMAAMLLPMLVMREGHLHLHRDNLFMWAALPTALIAYLTRSFAGTVATGVVLIAGTRYWVG